MTFLHLGFPKCASTLLQRRVFTEANGFFNIAASRSWMPVLQHHIVTAQSTAFDPTHAAPVDLPAKVRNKGLELGMSYEGCLDSLMMADYRLVLERLRRMFGDARVLIVIRRQEDLLFSDYVQLLRAGFVGSYRDFVEYMIWDRRQTLWGRMRFFQVYEETRQVFSDVLMLPYEILRADRPAFAARLSTFFGRPIAVPDETVNQSSGRWGIAVMRIGNRLFRHGLGLPFGAVLPSYCVGPGKFDAAGLAPREPSTWRRQAILKLAERCDGWRMQRPDAEKQAGNRAFAAHFDREFAEQNRRLDAELGGLLTRHGYVGCVPVAARSEPGG